MYIVLVTNCIEGSELKDFFTLHLFISAHMILFGGAHKLKIQKQLPRNKLPPKKFAPKSLQSIFQSAAAQFSIIDFHVSISGCFYCIILIMVA